MPLLPTSIMSFPKSGKPQQSASSRQALNFPCRPVISPKDILRLRAPTPDFLIPFTPCPPVQFLGFSVKDKATGETFFEFKLPGEPGDHVPLEPIQVPEGVDPNAFRTVDYVMSSRFLDCQDVSTGLIFGVGSKPLNNFRMIERHYVGSALMKSFDFEFGFCIPSSVNTWESIYSVPPLDKRMRKAMMETPGATKVDSFYFVDGQLVMHHKASFTFCDDA